MQSLSSIGCTAASTTSSDTAESAESTPNREPLRVLVMGSRKGVTSTIQTLHRIGFAEVKEWSPLLPVPNSGEVMSILTRYLLLELID